MLIKFFLLAVVIHNVTGFKAPLRKRVCYFFKANMWLRRKKYCELYERKEWLEIELSEYEKVVDISVFNLCGQLVVCWRGEPAMQIVKSQCMDHTKESGRIFC